MRTWLTVAVGVLLALGAITLAVVFQGEASRTAGCEPSATSDAFPGASSEVRCALPTDTLQRLDGEGSINLADLRGRPAVINFWASWCEPCVREMPLLARAAQELDGQVAFIGIDVQDIDDKALALAKRAGVSYPLARDPQGEFYARIGGSGMPTTLFVDGDGTVVYRRTGEVDAAQLQALLRQWLAITWKPVANG